MASEPYIRPTLWATLGNRLDPAAELDVWQEDLRTLLDDRSPEPAELYAFLLVTLTCRLRRVRPEMVDAALQQRAELRLAEDAAGWARLALEVPNPAAWREDFQWLADSYDQEVDPGEQAELACQLVEDLDDVDLALWFARTQGLEDPELDGQLAACHRLLAEQGDLLLAASVLVQTVGQLLRPDLATLDDGLGRTADKYRVLLDAFVTAEEEMDFTHQPVLSLAEREALLAAKTRPGERPVPPAAERGTSSWLPADRSLHIAAAVPGSHAVDEITWLSPDGRIEAVLSFDPEGTGGATEAAWLVFLRRDVSQTPAAELAGQPVDLAGVPGVIDARAEVAFPLGQLRAAASEPTLSVGREGSVWRRRARDV